MARRAQRRSDHPSLAKFIIFNVSAGVGLATGLVLLWLAVAADPQAAALIDDSLAPATTLLIVTGSLALYLAFGMTLTGLLLQSPVKS